MTNGLDFLKKALRAYQEKRLFPTICSRAKTSFYGLRYAISNPATVKISLHCPDYVKPSEEKAEMEIVERIFQSFRKMKEDQQKVSECYLPSTFWQEILDNSYSYLISGLNTNDLNKFHFFLANFGTWKEAHAIEGNTLIRDNMTSLLRRTYLKNVVFNGQLKTWKWFYCNRKPIASLNYPTYGNHAGAYIDDIFVGVGSFFNEIYGSILSELINDIERPIVADLGAGYGKLAYFTLRNRDDFTFIDFDLPETLCLAAYYLMKVWPDKRVLLYGEEDYSPEKHNEYDLIFMPSYEICKAGQSSIDLFLNKNSLGEMTKEAVENYINYISQATKYFFHMNRDVHPNIFPNKDCGLLGYEYPVPADKFKLLFRYPDIGHMFCLGEVDYIAGVFFYLYERKKDQ